MQWDSALVKAWRNDYLMEYTARNFMGATGTSVVDLKSMLRAPKHNHHWRRPVRVFVANGMPVLSDWLWDGKLTNAEIVLKLADSKMDVARGYQANGTQERRSENKDQRQLFVVHQHRGHRRSDWHVCKA